MVAGHHHQAVGLLVVLLLYRSVGHDFCSRENELLTNSDRHANTNLSFIPDISISHDECSDELTLTYASW